MERRVALINNTNLLTDNIVSAIRRNAVRHGPTNGVFAVLYQNTDSNDPCFGDLLPDEVMSREFPLDPLIFPMYAEIIPEVRAYDVVRNSSKAIGWICVCIRIDGYDDGCPDYILDGLDAAVKRTVPCHIKRGTLS